MKKPGYKWYSKGMQTRTSITDSTCGTQTMFTSGGNYYHVGSVKKGCRC